MKERTIMACICLLWCLSALSQTCVVVDEESREPIAHASLFTRYAGAFHSVTTDEQGRVTVHFPFTTLTLSHLNYERRQVRHITDTMTLKPKYRSTAEVVVRYKEPSWIRPMLQRFVKRKEALYKRVDRVLRYQYISQSIAADKFYHYLSEGWLKQTDKGFSLSQERGEIIAIDSTMLTDISNLRRLLYEDFVSELDADFIKKHLFYVNGEYQGAKGEVELSFRDKKKRGDRGAFVIDTVRCVILSARRTIATAANTHLRIKPFMLSLQRMLSGYKILQWEAISHFAYRADSTGVFFPSESGYKFFFQSEEKTPDEDGDAFLKEIGGSFTNMESRLSIVPASSAPADSTWFSLPRPWYMKYLTDADRAYEVSLAHLPATFTTLQTDTLP